MKNLQLFLVFSFFSFCFNAQNINIVNSSSYSSNTLEYNTGEVFVVYTFNNVQYTGKIANQDASVGNTDKTYGIKLFPNPVKTDLSYELPENIPFECVEVYDNNEKRLWYSMTDEKTISLLGFPSGTYFIRFNHNLLYNFKIVKQ